MVFEIHNINLMCWTRIKSKLLCVLLKKKKKMTSTHIIFYKKYAVTYINFKALQSYLQKSQHGRTNKQPLIINIFLLF